MPRRDGTGPMGQGAITGRGLGFCTRVNVGRYGVRSFGRGYKRGLGLGMGLGFACRRGFGRYFRGQFSGLTDKEGLAEQKELLQNRLDIISEQLDNLSEDNK
jgi:uncharacterized protein DUF5320